MILLLNLFKLGGGVLNNRSLLDYNEGKRSRETMSWERVFKAMRKIHLKNRIPRKAIRVVPKYWDNVEKGNQQGRSSSFNLQKKNVR